MTGLSLALANLKPGTGKTTSAVWLAHVFAQAGNSVLLVDADPSGSALEWSDLAAMDPQLTPREAFPFRVVALPSRELHRRLPEIARDDDVVIIDTPQLEDHAAIARSALRYADEIVIPCAPNPIEINRTTPVRDEIAEMEPVRDRPARSAILLNRCITRAHSVSDARQALQDLGYDVLSTSGAAAGGVRPELRHADPGHWLRCVAPGGPRSHRPVPPAVLGAVMTRPRHRSRPPDRDRAGMFPCRLADPVRAMIRVEAESLLPSANTALAAETGHGRVRCRRCTLASPGPRAGAD